jgi:hypothetical protein
MPTASCVTTRSRGALVRAELAATDPTTLDPNMGRFMVKLAALMR